MHVNNSSVTICYEIQIQSMIRIESLGLFTCACYSISIKNRFTGTAIRAESIPVFDIDITTHPNSSSALVKILESHNSKNDNDNDDNTEKVENKRA